MPLSLLTLPGGPKNPGIPGNYVRNYWQGAVTFATNTVLQGGSAVSMTSRYGVISFWVNLENTHSGPPIVFGRQARIYQPGPNLLIYGNDADGNSINTMDAGIYVGPPGDINFGGGSVLLNLCTFETGVQLGSYAVALKTFPQTTPPSGWHHCIWSWDAGQLVSRPLGDDLSAKVIRVQFAWDRGGAPADGGGVYDTGTLNTVGSSPQMMPTAGGASSDFPTGTSNATGLSTEWKITSLADSPISYAYCYAGFSDALFDLTNPDNLSQFVTTTLTPVNLGYSGRNPTNQQTKTPLTCLFMHTGNATNETLDDITSHIPTWKAGADYKSTSDPSFTAWVQAGVGQFYFALKDSGPTFGGPVVPGTDSSVWAGPATTPYGQEFILNGANGFLWAVGGEIETAPTQPDTGG